MTGNTVVAERAGFIGLGMMGLPMARNLAGVAVEVLVHDVQADAVAAAVSHPRITALSGPRQIAASCGIVFTCLPSPQAVRQVHLGRNGLLAGAHDGLIVCELSTTSPELSMEVGSALAKRGARYVETMMIGPPATARSGELFFIVGGDEALGQHIEPALAAMGRGWHWVGGLGGASRAKLLHNALGMIHMAATAEIMGLCMVTGIDPDAFADIIRQSPKSEGIGYSTVFDLFSTSIAHGFPTGTGKLNIAAKDTKLARALAERASYPTPLLDDASAMFQEAMDAGLGEHEYTRVSKVVEARFGSTIFAEPEQKTS